ncbi:MAG: response regulator [Chloroflexota bacterium]
MAARKILFIDGDAASRKFVAAALGQHGYAVELAASGQNGLLAAWREPHAVIVTDPATLDLPGEQLAARLRSDARTANVPLVALSSDPDPAHLKSCMQAGFSDFFVKSPDAMPALIDRLAAYLGTGTQAHKEARGLLIAFLSAKGGTGTSSLCANLVMNMAEQQPESRFVVVDLVLPLGSIGGIAGYEGPQNLVSVVSRPQSEVTPEFLRANLPHSDRWRFQVLPGPPDPESANEVDVGRIDDIVVKLQSAFDFVVIDLGRSLSRISLPLIQQADLIVMIVGTDVSTVTLSKTIWEYLQSQGVQAASVYMILNRAVGLEGLTKTEAEKIIGLPIRIAVPYLAGDFALANNQHIPYCVKYPGDTASIIFKDAAREMVALAARLRAPA